MYSSSIRLFRQLWAYVAFTVCCAVTMELFAEYLSGPLSALVAHLFIWSYLAYSAHAFILLPSNFDRAEINKRIFGFVMRELCLFALIILMTISLVPLVSALGVYKLGTLDTFTSQFVLSIFIAITSVIAIGLFGTVLPAFVTDHQRGFGRAMARGSSQFLWTAGHLLAGPLLVFAISGLAVARLPGILAIDSGLLTSAGVPNLPGFIISTIFYSVDALGTVMIAWVLSTAYQRAEKISPAGIKV